MRTVLALMMTLLLTGCAAASMTMVENDPRPAEEALVETQEETVRYTVTLGEWSDEAQTEEGIPLAGYVFRLPVLTPVRKDGTVIETARNESEERALAVTAVFNEKFEKWAAAEDFAEMVESAEEDLSWREMEGIEWFGGYELDLSCTAYQTDHLVSVCGTYYANTGGAHPNTWFLGWNFDLEDGVFFEADVLSDNAELQNAVAAEIIRQAGAPAEDGYVPIEMYWEDHEAIIANWTSYAVTFDEAGMRVVFSPYELAPYAAGPQEFLLSYEWLGPHLGDHGRTLLDLEDN